MDLVPILSTIILISTLITLIVAIASYMTFRIKEKRKQAAMAEFSEVFSSDLADLQNSDPDEGDISASTVIEPLVMMTPQPAAAPVTVNIQQSNPASPNPAVPQQSPAGFPAGGPGSPNPGFQQQGYPQQLPQGNPGSPNPGFGQQQGYPQQYPQQIPQQQPWQHYPPQMDPYGMPYPQQQQPPQPNYSGAQAAFMKGFDGQQGGSQNGGQPQPQQGGDYPQPPAMRRFTPPEAKPRQEPPQSFGNDSPTWK